MESIWKIIFVVEQTVFLFALGWFIRLLILYSKEVKELSKQYSELDKDYGIHKENNLQLFKQIDDRLKRIENKIEKLFEEFM